MSMEKQMHDFSEHMGYKISQKLLSELSYPLLMTREEDIGDSPGQLDPRHSKVIHLEAIRNVSLQYGAITCKTRCIKQARGHSSQM